MLEAATKWIPLDLIRNRLSPSESKAWCFLGKHYQSQRQFENSLYPLKKCSSLDPSADNLVSYGSALFDYGNIDGALKTLKKAVEKDAKNTKALYYYGLVLAWVHPFLRGLIISDATV